VAKATETLSPRLHQRDVPGREAGNLVPATASIRSVAVRYTRAADILPRQ